jgi:hypothetical protein
MKKTQKRIENKLKLHKETLRQLSDLQLSQAAGGDNFTCSTATCYVPMK